MNPESTLHPDAAIANLPATDIPDTRGLWIVAIGLAGLLGIAGWLRPSPNGMGTHQQLGLPPCTATVLFGIRCPACGMTTSWAHFMRGQWWWSFRVNPGGFALALQATATIPTLMVFAVRHRRLTSLFWWITVISLIFAFTAAFIDWTVRILA